MMRGAVDRGSSRSIKINGYNLGGKTGTSNDVKDVWFIGFSPDLVVGVFVGMDDNKSLGNELSATKFAGPIFNKFMRKVLADSKPLQFKTPNGIEMAWVDYKTGKLTTPDKHVGSGVILEAFKEGELEKRREAENSTTEQVEQLIEESGGIY
jgi:penicillin-binding protein 1A